MTVPTTAQGDVMSDLSARRGHISATTSLDDGTVLIEASVPEAELARYVLDLRSLTGGRGRAVDGARPLRGVPRPPGPRVTDERELAELTRLVREFSTERDWQQFHDPKSVILALVGEVGRAGRAVPVGAGATEAVARFADAVRKARAAEEMADVLVYLVCLADVLGVDLGEAARAKLADSHRRFAADEVRGVAPDKP